MHSRPMEAAYQYLKSRILDGTFKPSQKLTEHELAEKIGVSRNTVKKALLKLEQENLVKIESNKGAYINAFTLEEVLNYLEIRELLEGLVARSAAAKITDEEIACLEQIINDMKRFLDNGQFDEYSSMNQKFHQVIYSASGKTQAVDLITVIKTQLLRYHFRTILVPGRNEESFKEHQLIFAALKERNADKAQETIMTHISHIRRTIERNYAYLQ